uniref:cellulase n=1 Tax=uncultured symbiotic protist of Mastotermes darwiniensis TaxID=403661 RepID=A4UX09_9EUKA|nr:putative glycosyl hydrolase family7 [uncultured symbiotic protist of Mastotermes darwiniensis]
MFVVLACLVFSAETHPKFQWKKCTKAGCTTVNGFLVHDKHIEGGTWHRGGDQLDYANEVGVVVSGGTVSQRLVSTYKGSKITGSRIYIMTEDEKYYEEFKFVGKELSYTVDMSQIPCGVNAALYSSEMPYNGKKTTDDPFGAEGGTGYCDANCVDGDCCPEFDIQEASSHAMVFTAHCCESAKHCDTSGCGYNPYRDSKDYTFWGGTINVNSPVTVVTQFVGVGSTLSEIRRLYVQGGRTIKAAQSLNDAFCKWGGAGQNAAYSMAKMGASFQKGHVIVFSLWASDGMSWMDGGNAGTCKSYNVASVKASQPNLKVTWSNLKFGDMDSTY